MRKYAVASLVILMLLLDGCMILLPGESQVRRKNGSRLAELNIGIDKDEAIEIMGTEMLLLWNMRMMYNPYRTETVKGADGNLYEVVYYYTRDPQKGANKNEELTPLVFKECKLTGWGWTYFNDITTGGKKR
ncbi:MAG: DUF3192 domain-containing protein [bacterium]|nr:DUF3192 domain-containing protein [bacterium]